MSQIVHPYGPPLRLVPPPEQPFVHAAEPPATPEGAADARARAAWLLLALVGPSDVAAARELWLDHAPRAFRGLLDAGAGDGGQGGFHYDGQRLVYVHDDTGRAVAARDVKRLAVLLALAVGYELSRQAAYVADGTTPVDQWQRQAAETVKDLYVAQALLAAGGTSALGGGPGEAGGAGGAGGNLRSIVTGDADAGPGAAGGLEYALDRLRLFAGEIADGEDRAGTADAIEARAALYAAASNATYEAVRRHAATTARDGRGRPLFAFERNVLDDGAVHCHATADAPSCPSETARGWQPVGTLSLPGNRACAMQCRCSVEYALAPPGGMGPGGLGAIARAYDPNVQMIAHLSRTAQSALAALKAHAEQASPPPPEITVHVVQAAAPTPPPAAPVRRDIERDARGFITRIVERAAPPATPEPPEPTITR